MSEQMALIKVEPVEVEVLDPEPVGYGEPAAVRSFADMIARAVVAQQEAPKLSENEKMYHWSAAFQEWLAEDPRTGAARPKNTIAAYSDAWNDFRQFCPKMPWAVEGIDVKAWVADLRQRPLAPHVQKGLERSGRRQPGQVGLSDSTINQWLAGISSFYSYCEEYDVRAKDGRMVKLFDGINPVKTRAVKRPKSKAFERTTWLDAEQLKSLLQAVRGYAEINAAKSLRDYALIRCYLATGARNREVREWQWGDLEQRGGKVFYRWENKGKSGLDELPASAWRAVEEYLRLTGRLATMQPGDYIFQPLSDSATRLKRADGSAVVENWDRNRPISPQEANRLLRQYAKRAGLEPDRLHIHCLRHSAYMLYREAGVDLEERSRLLHHSSLSTTQIYDHKISGQVNTGWARAEALLGLS